MTKDENVSVLHVDTNISRISQRKAVVNDDLAMHVIVQ